MIRLAILVSCVGFLGGLVHGSHHHKQVTLCTHGESSTIVAVQAGRIVTVQPPTLTGCKP